VLALNRLDEQHMDKGKTVVIPDSFDDQEAFESFPLTIPALKEVPKIMLVSQRLQAFALYENGDRIRSGPVSTGKKSTPSPSKLYFTNWKGKLVTSSIDDEWIMPWYFNLDNKLGVSMHQYDLPGYPASHACIRMYEWDAKFIYDWADQWKVSDDGESVLAHGTTPNPREF
jgi:lipoprotein-anchoring transpeptidase ErfK/SrfK